MTDQYDSCLSIEGHGEAIVLVPGIAGSDRLYYGQLPKLTPRYRVATYALRNDAVSMEQLVADLSAVVAAANPEGRRAILVGESFGGAIALSFAVAHPEQVSELVILNSFPCFLPKARLHLAIAGLRIVPWGAMTLVRRLTAFRLHSRHTHRAEVRRFIELTSDLSREGYIGRLQMLTRYDVRDRLQEIRAPTLLLAAELDHLVPSVQQARFMSERIPGSRLRILEGHGHICLIAPDLDLAQILDEWRRADRA
jgi:pimeloyl-ACP methyl ester carboxylesterase